MKGYLHMMYRQAEVAIKTSLGRGAYGSEMNLISHSSHLSWLPLN